MPTYDYKCPGCGESFEAIVPITSSGMRICKCGAVAIKQFSPNRNIFIPERFGLSRTWHMSDTGSSADGMVGNNSQVHAPQRETFSEAFDKTWDKMGVA